MGVPALKSDETASRKSFTFEVKAVEEDGTFKGYGSVFGVVDFYNEVVVAGAFKKSLSKHKREGTMPALLWQHDPHEPIGIFTTMKEDEKGLYVEGKLFIDASVPNADKAYTLLKNGALTGLSIGFMTIADTWDDKKKLRNLTEVDLWETSLVTFPANTAARITAVKNLAGLNVEQLHQYKRHIEIALRDAGASIGVAQYVASLIPASRDAKGVESAKSALDKALNILKG